MRIPCLYQFIRRRQFYNNPNPAHCKYRPIRQYYGCRNYFLTLIKNLEPVNLLKVLPLHLACWLILSFAVIIRGDFNRGFIIIRAIIWPSLHFTTVLVKRKWVQNHLRRVPDNVFGNLCHSQPLSYYLGKAKAYVESKPF